MRNHRPSLLVGVFALLLAALPAHALAQDAEPVVVPDVYIEMDDGVRLASDIYLPPGTPTDGSVQVPCLVELTPYRKEDRAAEGAGLLPANGFGLVEVDARGTGGSEGEYDIVFSLREQWDAAALIDWAAQESGYCTDRVGMWGGSYSGIIQYLTASLPDDRAPQHLAAIAPQRAYGDLYRDIVYHGGQVIGSFGVIWSSGTSAYYAEPPTNVLSEQGARAWADHFTKNDPMIVPYLERPYLDGQEWCSDDGTTEYCQQLYTDSSVLPRIERLRVPTLHLAGWFDAFTRGQLLTFQEALRLEREAPAGERGPNYLVIGPWNHTGTHFTHYPDLEQRVVEWYRHWLADGPEPDWFGPDRLRYYQMDDGALDDDSGAWRTGRTWPVEADHERRYLHADGSLGQDAPEDAATATWFYDPTTGVSEFPSRWDNAAGVPQSENDQRLDGDRSGATFMTQELDAPLELTGPIALRAFISTEGIGDDSEQPPDWPQLLDQIAPPYHDTDFVVKLSDVAPDGTATLITEGFLRASHRAVDEARSQTADGEVVVPFHPHTREALKPPVPGETHEYLIEIWPTAKTFPEGHRLRIDIYSADTPNHVNLARPARNTIHLGGDTASYLVLPVAGDAASPPPASDRSGEPSGSDSDQSLPSTGGGAGLAGIAIAVALLGRRPGRRRWRG